MSKVYAAIKKIDNDIKFWEQLVNEYPANDNYRDALSSLRYHRTECVQMIGKKNEAKRSKCAGNGKA